MDNRKVFEEGVLLARDGVAERGEDNAAEMLAELLKSAILKPYREAYYQELAEGKVYKENVEKAVDFSFSDICVSFRALPNLIDEEKDREIKAAKQLTDSCSNCRSCFTYDFKSFKMTRYDQNECSYLWLK